MVDLCYIFYLMICEKCTCDVFGSKKISVYYVFIGGLPVMYVREEVTRYGALGISVGLERRDCLGMTGLGEEGLLRDVWRGGGGTA